MNWIVKELQWKAENFKQTGSTFALDPGVFKSDTAIPSELKQTLKDSSNSLEQAGHTKDFQPGTSDMIVNPVDPSLCPVVFGRTHILADQIIGLHDCLCKGEGVPLPIPPEDQAHLNLKDRPWTPEDIQKAKPYSRRFQWLPCNVSLNETGGFRITSYINNLPPWDNQQLHEGIEGIITQTIPLWDLTLTYVQKKWSRIHYERVEFLEGDYDVVSSLDDPCTVILPEPGGFEPPNVTKEMVNLQKQFSEKGLQVIVKMTNVELTPEKPDYDGSLWCLEGQLVSLVSRLTESLLLKPPRTSTSARQPSITTTART